MKADPEIRYEKKKKRCLRHTRIKRVVYFADYLHNAIVSLELSQMQSMIRVPPPQNRLNGNSNVLLSRAHAGRLQVHAVWFEPRLNMKAMLTKRT